jgi:hypothetical protein
VLRVKPDDGFVSWKIWILPTLVENLVQYLENEELLRRPGRKIDNDD